MKLSIYSVFDLKAAFYGSPFFSHNDGAAVRSFTDAATDPQTMLAKHPEDFSLYLLGEFDDATGLVTSCLPRPLVTASQLVKPEVLRVPFDPNSADVVRKYAGEQGSKILNGVSES